MDERPSRFSDVCGTIDEFKRLLHEEADLVAANPAALEALIDDALLMERRMARRLAEYERFRERVAALTAALREIDGATLQEALDEAPPLRAALHGWRDLTGQQRAAAIERAERIRAVAQGLENRLYRYKELALALEAAYREIKGARSWALDGDMAASDAPTPGDPPWARWLPPSPSRERIMRYLRVGRAHLIPATTESGAGEQAPLVQFEDGGVMPLPLVRWSEELRNFHPADAPANARGLLYRD